MATQVYSSDGKLLVARSTKPNSGVVYGDCWKIPGGGVDEGETHLDALKREVLEESGIDISTRDIELIDDTMTGGSEKTLRDTGEKVLAKMKFFTYKVVLDKPVDEIEVTPDPNEFDEYRWIETSGLKDLNLSPPSIEIFTKLGFL